MTSDWHSSDKGERDNKNNKRKDSKSLDPNAYYILKKRFDGNSYSEVANKEDYLKRNNSMLLGE